MKLIALISQIALVTGSHPVHWELCAWGRRQQGPPELHCAFFQWLQVHEK